LPQGDTETNLLALSPSKLDDEVKKHSSTSYKGIDTEVHGDRQDALVPLEAISRVEVSPRFSTKREEQSQISINYQDELF
jgi:hypothetical protein